MKTYTVSYKLIVPGSVLVEVKSQEAAIEAVCEMDGDCPQLLKDSVQVELK